MGPSYSSPWFPPSRTTVGPVPLAITPQGDACDAPGIVMGRMRDHQETGLFALSLEIDGREGGARPDGGCSVHGDSWDAGVAAQIGAVQKRGSSSASATARAMAASKGLPLRGTRDRRVAHHTIERPRADLPPAIGAAIGAFDRGCAWNVGGPCTGDRICSSDVRPAPAPASSRFPLRRHAAPRSASRAAGESRLQRSANRRRSRSAAGAGSSAP